MWDNEPSWVWKRLIPQTKAKMEPTVHLIPAFDVDEAPEDEVEEVLNNISWDTVDGAIWVIHENRDIETLTKIINALDNSGINWR